ncbi:hypothetical protein [Achromobacter animicus]|uniref:hypothetical protein n=1 Tax=Achromobacter animicus TaxID=1389935 RepID=UPI0028ABBA1A|nr:hypothetical protein [Achromobacter animicus]
MLFIDASNEARRRGAGAVKKPDVWQSHAVSGRCGACPSRVTPVLHLNTGVFFCEDTFLWFRSVTVGRREIARHPLKQRLIPDLLQKNIMYYRYIIFSFRRFQPINSCGFFLLPVLLQRRATAAVQWAGKALQANERYDF